MATVTVSEEPVTTVKKTVTLVMNEAEARRVSERLNVDPPIAGDDGVSIGSAIWFALG